MEIRESHKKLVDLAQTGTAVAITIVLQKSLR